MSNVFRLLVQNVIFLRLNLYNEVRILQTVSHPCIIKLEDVIDTPKFLFIVLELADGGELFDKIVEKSKVPEGDAKLYFYQICSAIEYLHAKVSNHSAGNRSSGHSDIQYSLLCRVSATVTSSPRTFSSARGKTLSLS